MYRLVRFGDVSIDYPNAVEEVGAGVSPSSYLTLPNGGSMDRFGSRQTAPGIVERSKKMNLLGSTTVELDGIFRGLMALRGKRDRLYRRMVVDDELQWTYARLTDVGSQRDYKISSFQRIQPVELSFACQEVTWRGEHVHGPWQLDTGIRLDDGYRLDGDSYPLADGTITLAHGAAADPGRAPIRDITILVRAGNAPMTAITLTTGAYTLSWSGTLAAGKALLIYTGSMRVTNDGADAYAGLSFAAAADLAAWFVLQPGDNAVAVNVTGGGTGGLIVIDYYEAWY